MIRESYKDNMAAFMQSALEFAEGADVIIGVDHYMQLLEAAHNAAQFEEDMQIAEGCDWANPEAMFSEGKEWIIEFLDGIVAELHK